MRRILLLFLFVMSMISASAVNYHSVGSNAEFCVYTFDGEFYLILSFEDDDENHLSNNTIVKFMLNDGTVIRLEGTDGSKSTSQSSIHWGFGVFSGSSSDKHYAIVRITPEQIEMLNKGVDKVAINTLPEAYKRSNWSGKENFGSRLYNDFKELKNEFEE